MSTPGYARIRPLLFRVDAETAHRHAVRLAGSAGSLLARASRVGWRVAPPTSPLLRRRLLGLDFPNPIGLAAGFDKNAVASHLWPALGFGFAELGTVTGLAQPGNPRPRLFRLEADEALINRLGFNNEGAEAVAARLDRSLRSRPRIPIGLNVGVSRVHVGDPSREIEDSRRSVRLLGRHADYLAVNVSSPNTPGLRDLQAPARLERLVEAVIGQVALLGLGVSAPKVLVKLSPDLPDEALAETCAAALSAGAAGFIATNTTLRRDGLRGDGADEAGGLSGRPLRDRADRVIARIRSVVGPEVPIIGVGGVASVADVMAKLRAGADLVALYTALIFHGPLLARALVQGLQRELERLGVGSVADVVGADEGRASTSGA